jgi:hypothetical protein
MSHIDFFIKQAEFVYNKRLIKNGTCGSSSGWLRPMMMFVVWRLNGINKVDVAKIFGVNNTSVHFAIGRILDSEYVREELFLRRYTELMNLYIKTTSSYLKKNQIYNLKQVA